MQPIEFKLIRDDSGPSRVYRDSEGMVYTSVTSFVGRFSSSKSEIEKWKNSIGETEAAKILKAAGTRGTAIHEAAEDLLLNRDWSKISMFYRQDFQVLKDHLEKTTDNIFALEHQMFSKSLKLAGTVDLIAEYNGIMSLIDFKTSSREKYRDEINSYFLQCAAYAIMAYERYKLRLNQLVILMVVEGSKEVSVFIEPTVPWAKQLLKLTREHNYENE